MSAFQQDSASNDAGRVQPNKSEKTRRSWSLREEEQLIAALKEIVVNGWRSDNGFRAGYLGKLEEAMKIAFPGTDLKGIPHIHSKISMWKRNYYSLSLMLRDSGIGFNVNGKFMIDCTLEQWDDIVKGDPSARGMKKKRLASFGRVEGDIWKGSSNWDNSRRCY
ncbi:uncharacterized protein LOC131025268 [Salvia miltiorrhiza]|uniref:uncharacterized protein LOC131025268 n=1 Tax=Salvia miltiorrhiza TaxID=226208 RepID=UPI0025AD1095|nr:uncharacterized protein LOC131025268 [Salvia miltiorrhiza]